MGPKPRDFSQKVNRKVAQLAFQRALSAQIEAGKVKVIESFDVGEGRTRLMAALLKQLDATGRTLLVTDGIDQAVELAARNIKRVGVVAVDNLDVYSLLVPRQIIVTRSAWDKLAARMQAAEVTA